MRMMAMFRGRRTRLQSRRQRIDQALGRDQPLTEAEIRRAMRPRGQRFWIFGTIVLGVLGAVLHVPLLGLAALVVAAMGVLPELWARISLHGVRLQRHIASPFARIGEPVRLTYAIENGKPFPVPWLEIEDEIADALLVRDVPLFQSHKPDRQLFIAAMSLQAMQRVIRHYTLLPLARGVFAFGPGYLRAGDPFGFLDTERGLPRRYDTDTLTVLPLSVPLERFGLPSRRPFGDLRSPRPTFEDPSQIIGIRDFQPQDSLRRVHWQATARMGQLQSKVYPPTIQHTVMICLDINTTANVAQGIEMALFELAIAATASVTTWAVEHDCAVGFATNGLPGNQATRFRDLRDMIAFQRIAPSTRPDQLVRIQRLLAGVQPAFGLAINGVLRREAGRLPLGATFIFISAAAAVRAETVRQLDRLRRQGHVVALLLTGAAAVDAGALLTYRLGGRERWYALANEHARRNGFPSGTGDPEWAADSTGDGAGDSHLRQPGFTVG